MWTVALKSLVGPRVPAREFLRRWPRYLLPLLVFLLAGVLLVISSAQPYWNIKMKAPQYPHGLTVTAYLTHLRGDVAELDTLNHYIGMKKLDEGGKLERATAVPALASMALLLVAASFVHTRWAVLLALPALLFPLLFLGDLQAWLYYFGNNLDKAAPLSSAIKPFTPKAIGLGKIGQFRTLAWLDQGFWMSVWASGATFVGLCLHRWAYKPLAEAARPGRRTNTKQPSVSQPHGHEALA